MRLLSQLSEEIYHLNRLSLCECAFSSKTEKHLCVKSVRIRGFSGPYFPAFGLNTDQKISNTDTFHVVHSRVTASTIKISTAKPPNSGHPK